MLIYHIDDTIMNAHPNRFVEAEHRLEHERALEADLALCGLRSLVLLEGEDAEREAILTSFGLEAVEGLHQFL